MQRRDLDDEFSVDGASGDSTGASSAGATSGDGEKEDDSDWSPEQGFVSSVKRLKLLVKDPELIKDPDYRD